VNRATAQTTQAAALSEGLAPLLRWVKALLDEAIERHLGYPDLEFIWSEEDAQDPATAARIADTYVRAGIKSVDEVRQELGLAPVGFGNAIYTGQGAEPLREVGKGATGVAKYNRDQPREPLGTPEGGRFAPKDDTETASAPIRSREIQVAQASNIGTVNDAVAEANPAPVDRHLTPGELALARSLFGDRINYDSIEIHNYKKYGIASDRAMAPDGEMYFPPGSGSYRDDFSTASAEDRARFLHELTHILQRQEGIAVGAISHLISRYSYELLDRGGNSPRFGDLDIERQAQIVQDYYLVKNGLRPSDRAQTAFPLSIYEKVLEIGDDGRIHAAVKRADDSSRDAGH